MEFQVALALLVLVVSIYDCNSHDGDKPKDWWQKTILYQIYPRSFKDSNGDGIGDLKGIISKLDHLKESGIGATWLSPIFQSPMADFGYDIENFTAIHDEYGTMDDFEELLVKAKKLGIKIILDYVPNHSSDQCEWFIKSANREDGFDDFYIWHDGKLNENNERIPPNNWQSVFYGSAWTWNDNRKQYYYHQFAKAQPDLNYRNPRVIQTMDNVMKFWLDKGVDGFRVDAVTHLYEVEDLRDEPETGLESDPNSYSFTHHYYTKDLPELYDIIYHWRELLDNYQKEHGGDARVMLTEAYTNITCTMDYYEDENGRKGAHIPFNFLLISDLDENSDARDFLFIINKWLSYMPLDGTANWVLGNHDQPRVGSRFGKQLVDGMNMLLLTLPGVAITYMGEEIGMVDYRDITWEQTKDPAAKNTNPEVYKKHSRDPVRTPFQWDDTTNAGFSNFETTWLPVHPDYKTLNLLQQKQTERSHYKLYKQLSNLRQHPTIQNGNFHPLAITRRVLAYKRELKGHETFIVVINLDGRETTVNLNHLGNIPETVIVVASGTDSLYKEGDIGTTVAVVLQEFEAVIFRTITSRGAALRQKLDSEYFYAGLRMLNLGLMGLGLYLFYNNRFGSLTGKLSSIYK